MLAIYIFIITSQMEVWTISITKINTRKKKTMVSALSLSSQPYDVPQSFSSGSQPCFIAGRYFNILVPFQNKNHAQSKGNPQWDSGQSLLGVTRRVGKQGTPRKAFVWQGKQPQILLIMLIVFKIPVMAEYHTLTWVIIICSFEPTFTTVQTILDSN